MSTSSPARSMVATAANAYEDDLRNVFEGQLYKFTNVVQGWQYRWFILNPQSGHLDYYLMSEGGHGELNIGKHRGSQPLVGTMVIPSDEDSHQFTVVFASGETYKLRASNTRERQMWVDRIRHVGQLFDSALASNHHSVTSILKPGTPPAGARSQLLSNGCPSDALQTLSLSVLDAFGSVHDILQQTDCKHNELARVIESLPMRPADNDSAEIELSCLDDDLLMLKATSQSALQCLESALTVLQELQDVNVRPNAPVIRMNPVSPKRSLSSALGLSAKAEGLSSLKFGGSSQSMNAGDSHQKKFNSDCMSVRSVQVAPSSPSRLLMPTNLQQISSVSSPSVATTSKTGVEMSSQQAPPSPGREKAGQGS